MQKAWLLSHVQTGTADGKTMHGQFEKMRVTVLLFTERVLWMLADAKWCAILACAAALAFACSLLNLLGGSAAGGDACVS